MKLQSYICLLVSAAFWFAATESYAQQPPENPEGVKSEKIDKQKKKADKESKGKNKKVKTRAAFLMEKTKGKVYVFGVSQMLGHDSVYITDISVIDSMALQDKTKFLPFRSSFSIQLQRYTEGVLGQSNQTVSIFYNEKLEKLNKSLRKVRKRYLSNESKTVIPITNEQFHFVHPLDMMDRIPVSE